MIPSFAFGDPASAGTRPFGTLAVFSDLHLAPPGPLNSNHTAAELAACLGALPADTLLILAGDVVDCLQIDPRPDVLDLAGAPELVTRLLNTLDPAGQSVLKALGHHAQAKGPVWILPGNHDPELAHPAVEVILRESAGLAADDARLQVRVESPIDLDVAGWQVRLGHGHAGDGWNELPAAEVRAAALRGEASLPLPAGSHMVLGSINGLKRKGWAFIDLLKPEGWLMFKLLLSLDAKGTLAGLPDFVGLQSRALMTAFRRRLRSGPVLGEPTAAPPDTLATRLADDLAAVFADLDEPFAIRLLEDALAGRTGAAGAVLSAGGASPRLLKAFHRETRGFFNLDQPSEHDQTLIEEHLPTDALLDTYVPTELRRRVLISGHTHAAREIKLPGDRVYLNTGTWIDLMRFPGEVGDPELAAWKAALLKNQVPRLQRLTYALVDEHGARLVWWKPDPWRP